MLPGTFNRLFFDEKIAKLSYLSELVSTAASFSVIADIIFPGTSEYYLNWNYFSHYNPAKGKIPFPTDFTFTILAVGEKVYPRQVTTRWRTFPSCCVCLATRIAPAPSINTVRSLPPINIADALTCIQAALIIITNLCTIDCQTVDFEPAFARISK